MKNKALLVGINQYPNSANNLRGCINDIIDMEYFIAEKNKVYPKDQIKKLTNAQATKKGILSLLNWLLEDIVAGDQILFQYSGHGAQLPTSHHQWEKDGLDEIICPYDFNGQPDTALSDKEFAQLFARIPQGVHFVWISDSCHAEDLSRDLFGEHTDVVYRAFNGIKSSAMDANFGASSSQNIINQSVINKPLNGALISACESHELSADAYIDKRFNGAFTHYLLKNLNEVGSHSSIEKLIQLVKKDLHKNGYDQNPQSEGLLDHKSFFQ